MSQPRGILLDIEGTTSSISFVHDVMFPFVLERLDSYLEQNFTDPEVQSACQQIAQDAGYESLASWCEKAQPAADARSLITAEVRRLMADDVKATGLKALQGLIWNGGFQSGALKAHVYDDVIPSIKAWRDAGIDVRIYSSGSIAAQKLFFGHLDHFGDCLHFFTGHYDTTSGGKKERESYLRVAEDWGLNPGQILFISDIAEELTAAQAAGMQTLASVRAGNAPLPDPFPIASINSFADVSF